MALLSTGELNRQTPRLEHLKVKQLDSQGSQCIPHKRRQLMKSNFLYCPKERLTELQFKSSDEDVTPLVNLSHLDGLGSKWPLH